MADKPACGSKRADLLNKAKHKRVIAVRARELAAHIPNEIDARSFISRAEEREWEAAELEAEAIRLPEDPH